VSSNAKDDNSQTKLFSQSDGKERIIEGEIQLKTFAVFHKTLMIFVPKL